MDFLLFFNFILYFQMLFKVLFSNQDHLIFTHVLIFKIHIVKVVYWYNTFFSCIFLNLSFVLQMPCMCMYICVHMCLHAHTCMCGEIDFSLIPIHTLIANKNEIWRAYSNRIKHNSYNYLNQGFEIQISIMKTGSHWRTLKLFFSCHNQSPV